MEFRAVTPFPKTRPTPVLESTNSAPVDGESTLQGVISPRSLSLQINGTRRPRPLGSRESPPPTANLTIAKFGSLTLQPVDGSPQHDANGQAVEKIRTTALRPDEETQDRRADSLRSRESSEADMPHDSIRKSKSRNNIKRLLPRSKNTADLHKFHDSNLAPASNRKLAEKINDQIARTSFIGNAQVRVLRIFFCAAGGIIPVNPEHPETDACAKRLTNLPTDQRFDCLQQLFIELGSYMTRQSILLTTAAIGKIFANRDAGGDPEEIYSILAELRSGLQEQFRLLDGSVNLQPIGN
jgi:hypothetical protein